MIPSPPVEETGESSAEASTVTTKAQTKARAGKGSGSGSSRKGSGSGSSRKGSGSGSVTVCPLPALDGIQWEAHAKGGWECWLAPEGANAPRRSKTYLGYVGKRKLAVWVALLDDQRKVIVEQWIADRKTEKGIAHSN